MSRYLKNKRLSNDKHSKCFKKIIVPHIVPPIVPSRVVPEVESVSELKIGIELLKLSNRMKKEFGACVLGQIGHFE